MKIAIITHSLRYNYGGILQNYAMQQALIKLGHQPVTLKVFRKFNKTQQIKSTIKHRVLTTIGKKVPYPITAESLRTICANTDKFIEKHICTSPAMGRIDHAWAISQKFDAYIVGSDQVLHPHSYPMIEDIYLSFDECPNKIMYAASFGTETWHYSAEQEANCKKLIKAFKAVALRENKGVGMMKEYLGHDATIVLDPTLLLKAEEYSTLFEDSIAGAPGVVTYFLDPTDEKHKLAESIATHLGCTVTCAGNERMDNLFIAPKNRVAPSVEEWLAKIKNAKFVVTDSYHGTIFSIIFGKQFVTVGNRKRGIDRFNTILGKLGLTGRMTDKDDVAKTKAYTEEIDYTRVNKILDRERAKSIEFLKQNLQ